MLWHIAVSTVVVVLVVVVVFVIAQTLCLCTGLECVVCEDRSRVAFSRLRFVEEEEKEEIVYSSNFWEKNEGLSHVPPQHSVRTYRDLCDTERFAGERGRKLTKTVDEPSQNHQRHPV